MALLYLVRHAIAEERDRQRFPDDATRPLSERGVARFRPAARGLARVVPTVELVLASPYVRAWQTAELLVEEAGWPAPERCEALEAIRDPAHVLEALRALGAWTAVALVGHEPGLSELASLLLAGDPDRVRLQLAKGSVMLLELPRAAAAGTATLRWSLTPTLLRRLGDSGDALGGSARWQRRGGPA